MWARALEERGFDDSQKKHTQTGASGIHALHDFVSCSLKGHMYMGSVDSVGTLAA